MLWVLTLPDLHPCLLSLSQNVHHFGFLLWILDRIPHIGLLGYKFSCSVFSSADLSISYIFGEGGMLLLLLLLLLSCFSRFRLCATPWTAAHQAPPSLGFSRREHWSGLPVPSAMHESEQWKWSRSVVSDSSQPHGLQPTRLLCPWDFPSKSTGVGCHFLLQCMKMKSESEVAQSCPTLRNPMDCSPPGSSDQRVFQARVLEWGAIAFSCSGR